MKEQLFIKVPIWGTSRHDLVPVEQKEDLLPHHKAGLSYTARGYGAKIPTTKKIQYNGKWYRVYCKIYSNSGTCYICGKFGDYSTLIVY